MIRRGCAPRKRGICAHLDRILETSPEANLMLFGDLNDTKNEYPIRQIIGLRGTPSYMMDLWLRDSRDERWTYYWKTADEYSRIDYLLVSPGLVREVVTEKCGIDDSPFGTKRAIIAPSTPPSSPSIRHEGVRLLVLAVLLTALPPERRRR